MIKKRQKVGNTPKIDNEGFNPKQKIMLSSLYVSNLKGLKRHHAINLLSNSNYSYKSNLSISMNAEYMIDLLIKIDCINLEKLQRFLNKRFDSAQIFSDDELL